MERTLGRYILLEQVGTGGMAVVYRGRDSALDREVAVKLLHPHLASRPESRARFSREARAVARLSHPSIVEIYDYSGDGASESYLVTEFVRGRTLRAYQQEVGFGFPEIGLLVGRALCDALVHAHGAGVIHRDLKPENVLVQEGERPGVKLADFGIARILSSDDRLTMTGGLVGSPHHMAPEIVEGRDADARSDLFSLGTLLYWLATGALPFAAANPTAILRRLLEGRFDDPRTVDPRISDATATLLDRLLSVDPAGRPGTAAEVRDALDAILLEVGIDAPGAALGRFLRDPVPFKAGFPSIAVAALRARAAAALAEGRSARAVAALGRILTLVPDDPEARRTLSSLTEGARRRRLLARSAVALLVAAVAAVGGWHGRGSLPSRTARTPVVQPEPPPAPPAEAPPAVSTAAASPAESAAPGAPRAAAGPPARAPDRGTEAPLPRSPPSVPAPAAHGPTLEIHVRPYAQRALLDGAEVAAGVQVLRIEVRPDHPHLVQIEHPCCVPYTHAFTAEEASRLGQLRVPLEPRPARLRVEGPPATRVLVEGRSLGTAGDSQRSPFDVPIPPGGSPYEGTVRLELFPPESPPRSVDLKLKAGADLVVAVPPVETSP